MPLYRYACPRCGHEMVELEKEPTTHECPKCSTLMKRVYGSFAVQFVYETGLAKTKLATGEEVWSRKHRNWTPPKDYVEKKKLDKLQVY